MKISSNRKKGDHGMKTKDVELITGLSKQTLIWYEKEGLIQPGRNENRYREYSDEDVKTLQLIKMLRGMDICIDDIRHILKHQVSMEEILDKQKAYLQKEEQRRKEIEDNVRFYSDTKAPMIEGLHEMYRPKRDWVNHQKPLEPFCIGACPNKKLLKKLLFWNILWLLGVVFFTVFFICNFKTVWGIPLPSVFIIQVFAGAILFCVFGFGIPQLGFMSVVNRYSHYAEFSRQGIYYVKADTLGERVCFLYQSLKGQRNMRFVPYSQIVKVTISKDMKYMRIATPFAHELPVTNIIFYFKDNTTCSLFNQMFDGNDEEIIVRILKEHIGQVLDLRHSSINA